VETIFGMSEHEFSIPLELLKRREAFFREQCALRGWAFDIQKLTTAQIFEIREMPEYPK